MGISCFSRTWCICWNCSQCGAPTLVWNDLSASSLGCRRIFFGVALNQSQFGSLGISRLYSCSFDYVATGCFKSLVPACVCGFEAVFCLRLPCFYVGILAVACYWLVRLLSACLVKKTQVVPYHNYVNITIQEEGEKSWNRGEMAQAK